MNLPDFTAEDIAEFGDLSNPTRRNLAHKALFAKYRKAQTNWIMPDEATSEWNRALNAEIRKFLQGQRAAQKAAQKERQEMASNPYAYLLKDRA